MLARTILVAVVLGGTWSAALAQPYQAATVEAAQEALIRLGHDPGPVDGQWGGRARAAMNALREANGLPPAKDFVGSSLELVHRLSPGDTTLPNPGILIADPAERRDLLPSVNGSDPAYFLCQARVGDGERLEDVLVGEPVMTVTAKVSGRGYIQRDDDWFTPILHAAMGAHNACVAGSATDCRNITTLMSSWAAADALKPGAKRSSPRAFDDVSWIGNSLLRNFIFAYADARRLEPLEPLEDAAVLDWFKRRVDDYHYLIPSGNRPGSFNYTEASNHALANMMPAAAFGALVGDRAMMEPALDRWREIMVEMRDDGSLPTEARRGARSLHYTNIQLGQLLATAELARAQGIDPAGPEAAEGKTVQKAVGFLLDAYENFDVVAPYAKVNEGPGPSEDYTIPFVLPHHLGWMPAYQARFGEDDNRRRVNSLVVDSRICSERAQAEHKFPDGACDRLTSRPSLAALAGLWGTADLPYMGYSAACLQGDGSWPVTR